MPGEVLVGFGVITPQQLLLAELVVVAPAVGNPLLLLKVVLQIPVAEEGVLIRQQRPQQVVQA